MNDFADWLSPILVKELRQGMRARAFMTICLSFPNSSDGRRMERTLSLVPKLHLGTQLSRQLHCLLPPFLISN